MMSEEPQDQPKMENIDLQAPIVKLAPPSISSESIRSGRSGLGSGFVPLVTVVGFHHAR